MPLQRSPGVVIHLTDYGEADKIVTFYSPSLGQWTGIAKGAKRSRRRFVNKLELFSLLDIDFSDHYSLPIINQAELINSHLPLRQHYPAYTAATLVCELCRSWTHQNDHDPELFSWLVWVLDRLCRGEGRLEALVIFLVKFYRRLGYQPNLTGCAACGALEGSPHPFRFRASQGTILCHRCQPHPSGPLLSLGTVKLLTKALSLPMERVDRLRLTPASTREALTLFKEYDRTLLDREGPSWSFITA